MKSFNLQFMAILVLSALFGAHLHEAMAQEGEPKQMEDYKGFYWKAWASQGGGHSSLNVAGVIEGGSPGYVASLKPADPPGFNPRILVLELTDRELPGAWPDVLTPIPAVYVRSPYKDDYDSITIRFKNGDEIHLDILKDDQSSSKDSSDK